MRDFARGEIFASWWTDAVEEFLSTGAHGFRLRMVSATTIESPAGPGNDQSSIAVNGRLRFNVATVNRVHPGGAAGTYDVFVTASDQNIVNTPQPNTDNTVYSYALAIVAAGATPAIVAGSVDIVRKVAELTWSGAAITSLRQTLVPRTDAPIEPTAPLASFPAVRARGVTGQTAPVLIVESATGVVLASVSPSGGLEVPGPVTIGGDTNIYRSAANVLKSDDTLDVPALRIAGTALDATPRRVAVYRAAGPQSIATNSITTVAWGAELYDLPGNNQHDNNAPNYSRLTCVEAGLYLIILGLDWGINAVGQRNGYILLNGMTVIGSDERLAIGTATGSVVRSYPLAVGDYLEAQVYQSSGAALNFVGGVGFSMIRQSA
jgi:hypothetical protein